MSENTPESGRYPHVVRTVSETPWAVEPQVLASIREMVALRASGHRFTADEIEARIGAGPARRDMQVTGSVAVIPIHGVITTRADMLTEMSGGTSVQRLQSAIQEAVSDKKVSAVVFDVSSPGGMTDMIPELAAEIRAARGRKPIVAVANTKAGSAAYWLAAQADELVVTPSGMVGSIGVFAAHDDISAALEKDGIKTTLVSAGKFKTEGNPFEPLSDEARAAIQARVDEMYGMFTADVAKGRRVAVDAVRSGYGQGRMLMSKQALAAGMVDGIETLQSVVDRLERGGARQTPGSVASEVFPGNVTFNTENVTFTESNATSNSNAHVTDVIELAAYSEFYTSSQGQSFTAEAHELHDRAVALAERLTSLAEVKRGSLTAAKREHLTACTGALRGVTDELERVLADTDPDKQRGTLDRALVGDIFRRHLAGS